MKFEKIKPGMTLYDVHSYRMGNTTIRTMGCWGVAVDSVDPETRTAMVRWNIVNRPERYSERQLKRLREVEPEMVRGFFGSERLMTRAEKNARDAKASK